MNGMNAEKLGQVVETLAHIRTVLDGGYHYSSPFLRTRGAGPDLPPPLLREKPDALGILSDVVEDLGCIAGSLSALAQQAKDLQIDTKAMCGADLALYSRVYEQLASDVNAAVLVAVQAMAGNGDSTPKPERRRMTRTPKASTGAQTAIRGLENDEPNPEETHHATTDRAASEIELT